MQQPRSYLAHKGRHYLGLFQNNQTVNRGGKFHTKKESLSLPSHLLPSLLSLISLLPLVHSSNHEYRAQITSRLNKVFSLPLEQTEAILESKGGREGRVHKMSSRGDTRLLLSLKPLFPLNILTLVSFNIKKGKHKSFNILILIHSNNVK